VVEWNTGVYQCSVEREHDRLFAISTVAMLDSVKPPLPEVPQIELTSCRPESFNRFVAQCMDWLTAEPLNTDSL